MNRLRVVAGLTCWLVLAAVLLTGFARERAAGDTQPQRWAVQLRDYFAGQRHSIDVELPGRLTLAAGDPVFHQLEDGTFRQVGEVTSVTAAKGGDSEEALRTARLLFYASAPELVDGTALDWQSTPDAMSWVLETMLPPAKRAELAREMSSAFEAHHQEILDALRPVVEASLAEGVQVIEEDLKAAIRRHRPELEKLGSRYQRDLIEREIAPLVRQEIWPVVRRETEPLANEIGLELWERVSLWRFTWRYLYDASPLPERNRLPAEWARFLAQEVFPLLEERNDDLVAAVQQVLMHSARNPRLQAAARRSITAAIEDDELRQIVWTMLREVIVDNPRLQEVLQRHWQSPQARRAFEIASERLEPSVQRMGALLFGSREEGITPEFAQVLRNRILAKDQRWLVLHVPTAPKGAEGDRPTVLRVRRGDSTARYPFVPAPPVRDHADRR